MTSNQIDFVVCGVITLAVLMLPQYFLSRLFRIEHDDFHDQWVEEGQPMSFPFWFPVKATRGFLFHPFPWLLGYKWMFKTPTWVKGYPAAKKQLFCYRVASCILHVGVLGLCLLEFVIVYKSH
jgi:hypothetical protein